MQTSMILLMTWCLNTVSTAVQYDGVKSAELGLGPQAESKRLVDEMSSTVLRRSPTGRSQASSQKSSRRSKPSNSNSSPKASRSDSNQDQRGHSRAQGAPTWTATSNTSNHQPSAARISRPVNRNTGTMRDLVRSMSPPQSADRSSSTRHRSASPPILRQIREESHNTAYPSDPFPARATIAMTGPGVIFKMWPNQGHSRMVVPPKKSALMEVTDSRAVYIGGKVYAQGHMIAEASGARTRSTLLSERGRGTLYMKDLLAEEFSRHGPQTHVQITSQGEVWHPKSATSRTYAKDGALSTAIGCSDHRMCFHPAWDTPFR